jgi:hypothetical protein
MLETGLLLIEAFTAIFFIGLSLPLIFNKVRPNDWYGVRVKKTLTNEDLWYKANAYFGKELLIASIIVLSACVFLFFVKDRMTLNTFLITVSTVLMLPYIVAVVKTFLYLRRL